MALSPARLRPGVHELPLPGLGLWALAMGAPMRWLPNSLPGVGHEPLPGLGWAEALGFRLGF